ncbi:hypothetical protein OKW32_001613 [Paraburkholderia youngii]
MRGVDGGVDGLGRCRCRRSRLGGAGGPVVAEAAVCGWQRVVEAARRALATLGTFTAACGASAGLATRGRPVAACTALVTVLTRGARRTLAALAVAAFCGFPEAALATLAFEAARGALAALASITTATLLRLTAIATEARTIGGIALPAHRAVVTPAAF